MNGQIRLVGTALDPKGCMIGWTNKLDLFYWHAEAQRWILIAGPGSNLEEI